MTAVVLSLSLSPPALLPELSAQMIFKLVRVPYTNRAEPPPLRTCSLSIVVLLINIALHDRISRA